MTKTEKTHLLSWLRPDAKNDSNLPAPSQKERPNLKAMRNIGRDYYNALACEEGKLTGCVSYYDIGNLTGVALDYAIALARGRIGLAAMIERNPHSTNFHPHSDAGIAVPIFEDLVDCELRKHTDYASNVKIICDAADASGNCFWVSFDDSKPIGGKTLTEAMMRAYVGYVFGGTVFIPKSLLTFVGIHERTFV
jgi:hypothetical protein